MAGLLSIAVVMGPSGQKNRRPHLELLAASLSGSPVQAFAKSSRLRSLKSASGQERASLTKVVITSNPRFEQQPWSGRLHCQNSEQLS